MKNTIKILGIIVLSAVIVFSMAACKKGSSSGAAAPVVTAPVSNSVDTLIAEYEKLVNDAAPLLQRLATGDTMAVIELSAIQEKVEELIVKFENIPESDFTPAQVEKWIELSNRMTSAFSN